MSESWVEKYRPEDWDDLQGNNSAIEEIREWIEDWERGDTPQLLVGPPGTGKTSTAYIAAKQTGMDFNEVDTSTARTTSDIERFAGEMRAGDQLVLLDETDSWPSNANLTPLAEELKDPQNPVILTANEKYDVPYALKNPSDVHEFSLSVASRRAKLKEVASEEGVPLDEKDLERLAERPDLRSAINDLQLHAEMGIPVDEDQRTWEGNEFEAMDSIIQHEDASDVDVRPPWLVMWLDQNLRKDCTGLELAATYDALSRADYHLGSAGGADYRGWRYAGILAEKVADLRLTDPYKGFIKWDFPEWVQSTMPSPDDEESEEAALYRELKGWGRPGFEFAGGYAHFRGTLLPLLRRLSASEREKMVVDHNLTKDAASALNVDGTAYEEAKVEATATEGDALDPSHGDAGDADW